MTEGTIFTVLTPSGLWPPPTEIEVLAQQKGDSRLRLIVDTNGRTGFQIQSPDSTREHWFQPVIFEGRGIVILSIVWSSQGVSLQMNAEEVLLNDEAQGEVLTIKTKGDQLPPEKFIIGDVDFSTANSEAEYLFLATLVDIERKVREGSYYSLIRAAGLLRQLFIDSSPLIHVVNRAYRQKIEFEILDHREEPPLPPDSDEKQLDVSLLPGAKTIVADLDGFLGAPCLSMDGVTATVRDLIRACANARGGVHLGKTRIAKESLVVDWDNIFRSLGEKPTLRILAGVCRISLRGLKPLANAIVGSGKT